MSQTAQDLLERIKTLETSWTKKSGAFRYRWLRGKAKFEDEVIREHRNLKVGLLGLCAPLSPPCFAYSPFDLSLSRAVRIARSFLVDLPNCLFLVYGIPKVNRADYIVFDRGRLGYLNLLERLNCAYCSYANGLCGYATEIAARTEQHWCPIKHAQRLRAPHSRYKRFFDYGDVQQYHRELERVRSDFVDITTIVPKS